jgi:hypothetical protein
MNRDSRYSYPPSAETLSASTASLTAALDKLEAGATPLPSAPLPNETEFFAVLRERLKAGQKTYGDKSFSREPGELLGELELEALDLAGWSYILWCRLRKLQAALRGAGVK